MRTKARVAVLVVLSIVFMALLSSRAGMTNEVFGAATKALVEVVKVVGE